MNENDDREVLALMLAEISGDAEATEGYRIRADRILAAGFRRPVDVGTPE